MLEPGICSLPNCGSPKYQDPSNGRIHEFCSRTHALAGMWHGNGTLCSSCFVACLVTQGRLPGEFHTFMLCTTDNSREITRGIPCAYEFDYNMHVIYYAIHLGLWLHTMCIITIVHARQLLTL